MLGKARSSSSFDGNRARSDLNRLLDPTYSTSCYNDNHAYVDAHGDLHDPDYRHFPLLQQSYNRRSPNATRPHWELIHEEASLLDNDDDLLLLEEDSHYYYSSSKRNSFGGYNKSLTSSPRNHYAASHRSSSPSRVGITSAYSRGVGAGGFSNLEVSPPTSWSSSSSSESSSSPASYDLRSSSPFDAASEKSRCRIASSLKSRRRRSGATASVSDKIRHAKRASRDFDDEVTHDYLYRQEWPVAEEEEQEVQEAEEREDMGSRRRVEQDLSSESVPTCSDVLKKRWQRLSLSIQFGMFRAERRIKRRVKSLL